MPRKKERTVTFTIRLGLSQIESSDMLTTMTTGSFAEGNKQNVNIKIPANVAGQGAILHFLEYFTDRELYFQHLIALTTTGPRHIIEQYILGKYLAIQEDDLKRIINGFSGGDYSKWHWRGDQFRDISFSNIAMLLKLWKHESRGRRVHLLHGLLAWYLESPQKRIGAFDSLVYLFSNKDIQYLEENNSLVVTYSGSEKLSNLIVLMFGGIIKIPKPIFLASHMPFPDISLLKSPRQIENFSENVFYEINIFFTEHVIY